jgi:hypothetical protein
LVVNHYGCQVWECHEKTTPDQPINSEVGLGAVFGYCFLALFVFLLFGIGMYFLLKFLKGRVSRFMHEQTHFRSIQWRIDLSRARALRAQLRDFFDRSMARIKGSKLEESIYSDISDPAKKSTSGLWTRMTSGIQTPIAAWKKACRESPKKEHVTPKKEHVTPKKENVTMPKRNLANEYTASPTTQSSSVVAPHLPPRNSSARANWREPKDALINFDDIEIVSSTSVTIEDTNEDVAYDEWASALGSPESAIPGVVRVGFNPNDQDFPDGRSNASNSAVGATGNNVIIDDNNSLYIDIKAAEKQMEAELAEALENVKLECNSENQSTAAFSGPLSFLQGVASAAASGVFSIFRTTKNEEADLSSDSLCEILQNRLDIEGGGDQPTGSLSATQLLQHPFFRSPGSPMAKSSPIVRDDSDGSSDEEMDQQTIQETVLTTETEAEKKVLVQDSTPAPLTAANVTDVETSAVYVNTSIYNNVTIPVRIAPAPPRRQNFVLHPPTLHLSLHLSPHPSPLPRPPLSPRVVVLRPPVHLSPYLSPLPRPPLSPRVVVLPPPVVALSPVVAVQQDVGNNLSHPAIVDAQDAVADPLLAQINANQHDAGNDLFAALNDLDALDQQNAVDNPFLPPPVDAVDQQDAGNDLQAPIDAFNALNQGNAEDNLLPVDVVDQQNAGNDLQAAIDALNALNQENAEDNLLPVDAVDQQDAGNNDLPANLVGQQGVADNILPPALVDVQQDAAQLLGDNVPPLSPALPAAALPPVANLGAIPKQKREYKKKQWAQTSNYNLRSKK